MGIHFGFIAKSYDKKYFLLILIGALPIYYLYTNQLVGLQQTTVRIEEVDTPVFNKLNHSKDSSTLLNTAVLENINYFINTSKCRIPRSDPFSEDIIEYLVYEKYEPCTTLGLLSYIDKSDGIVSLRINSSLLHQYSSIEVTCCYSNITRINYIDDVDNEIEFTPCIPFHNSVNLYFPFVKVVCSNILKDVYVNVHATTLPKRKEVSTPNTDKKYSILLVGIDSMSKSNLIRTMPRTHSYLEKHFISLKGYNKIGDNTFPNLMALMTGYSKAQLDDFCNTSVKMNNCRFVWDAFKNSGYVTAYAEDECCISTFNYDRLGFRDPPTDFYYHPYLLASETLPTVRRYDMTFCSGPETSAERMLNAAKDFSVTFDQVPSFGLFWMNSFSHDNVNLPTAMDDPMLSFLSDEKLNASLKNTIVIVFSDHGFRFGDIRHTHTGWLEERLPFIYFYIPVALREEFPGKYDNFLVNSARLTTPYDVFNTFQDVLKTGDDTYVTTRSHGCPECRSLFEEIPENRTCKDASIDQHWCTCNGHQYIDPGTPLVRHVGRFVVAEINNLIHKFREASSCAKYDMKKIISAGMSDSYINEQNETVRYFLVMVETEPKAMFEATVEAFLRGQNNTLELLGGISRIDRYADVSRCVRDGTLRKYCYCDGS